jgi:TATA-box binding protein (TBP) (component of TFIID and TFIIIB)
MNLFKSIHESNNHIITPINISTMTVIGKLENVFDINEFYNENIFNLHIDKDLYVENKESKFTKKGKPIKSFRNQITFKSLTRKCNIKIFCNGNLQMTGIKSNEDIELFSKKISGILKTNIHSIEVVMINVVYKFLDRQLHLYDIYDKLISLDLNTHYTPEIYPGLKLKIHTATALIFATGSVIISSKCIQDTIHIIDELFLLFNKV